MHQESLENMKLVAQFRSIDIFAMPLYFPVRHSHCTTAKFTVLVSCSGELAVHSFAWSNLRANFFWCWCLLRNNIMAANLQRFASSYDRRRFTTCCVWTLVLPTGPRQGEGRGGNVPGRHFWWKEGIANGLSRMNVKLDLSFRFWLRLDQSYAPVWPGVSRFKRLSHCPVPVSKMSRNCTSV